MIGEVKLWKKSMNGKAWKIIKIFNTLDTSIKRLNWLKIYEEDHPDDEFQLSTHNPDKSVGE